MIPPAMSAALAPQARGVSLRLAGTCLTLAVLAALVGIFPHMRYVALSMTLLGLYVAYVRVRPESQNRDLFEIIIPFGFLNFVYFGVGTLYLVFRPEALAYPSLRPYLAPALMLEILGSVFFIAGYGWLALETRPSPLGRYEPSNVLVCLVPTAIGALSLSVHVLQEASMRSGGGISAALSFMQQFVGLFFFGWFLCWYQFWTGRFRRLKAVTVLASASLCAAMVLYYTLGGKALAILVLGIPAVAYYQARRRLPWKTILVVGLIAVFVIFPLYNTFRFTDRELGTARRMNVTMSMAWKWNSHQFAEASVFSALKRVTLATSVAAILSDVDRWVDFRYGETLVLAPIGLFIPRFIWPDKPNISIGREFGETFRLIHAMDRETEVALSMLGEFYWNFSIPGVVVGMTLMGMAYRWYYRRYGAGQGYDPIRRSIYVALLPMAILFDGSFAIVVGGFVKSLVIIVCAVMLMRRVGWLRELRPA